MNIPAAADQLTLQQRSADEIKKVLQEQSAQLQDLRRRQQSFSQDFLSNIHGNATWDGALWVINRLARLMK